MTFDFGAPATHASQRYWGQPNWAPIESAHNEWRSSPSRAILPLIALVSGETREAHSANTVFDDSASLRLPLLLQFGTLLFSVKLFIEFKEPKLIRPERKILAADSWKKAVALKRYKEEALEGAIEGVTPRPIGVIILNTSPAISWQSEVKNNPSEMTGGSQTAMAVSSLWSLVLFLFPLWYYNLLRLHARGFSQHCTI